jgi:hypothetical protein
MSASSGRGPGPPLMDRRLGGVTRRLRVGSRTGADRGSATVEFVICAAGMVMLLVMVVQVGVWYHTRAVAQTAARHGLDHVRVIGGSVDQGIAVTGEFLAQSGGGLRHRQVQATRTVEASTVSVSGQVVSILPGVSLPVSVSVAAPTERIEP